MLYAASTFFLLQSMSVPSFIDRAIYGDWYGKGGDKLTLTLNLLAIFTSLFLFWSGTRKMRVARFNRVLPLAAASFLLISVLWSVDPRVTLTQGAAYFFVVLGAIGLVDVLDGDAVIELAALICGLSAAASIVQFFVFPEPGDFRGIFPHKNVLGEVMAAGVLTALHGMRVRSGRRLRYVSITALCTIVGLMSKSTTSALTIIIFFWLDLLGKFYFRPGSTRVLGISLAIVSVPVALFFMMNGDLIFDLAGKDRSFSGRTLIWPHVIDKIGQSPLLGWGFCAFWSPENPLALQIAEAIRGEDNWFTFMIVEAHNGLLEFLLEIGFIGTSLFMFLLIRNFAIALKCLNSSGRQFGLTSVILLIGILVNAFSEEVLLAGGQVWTSLFFLMGFICEQKLWLARTARRQGMVGSGPHRPLVSRGPPQHAVSGAATAPTYRHH